jgi:peptide/nickel transport system substrate-binding protein
MRDWNRVGAVYVALAIAILGCAAPSTSVPPPSAGPQKSTAPKRITAAVMSEVQSLSERRQLQGRGAGGDEVGQLVNAALVRGDGVGNAYGELAESQPSINNGLWRLLPDGRMETTWRLRESTAWHDGAPFTSDDVRFTVNLGQDRELAMQGDQAFSLIEGVDTPDPRTITVRWKGPYIEADTLFSHGLFSYGLAVPLPRHLLERAYAESKTTLFEHPYWTDEFIGAGPFRLREFARGSHLLLGANDAYVLGRPRIDEIEVRFITALSSLVATVLAGELDFTMGRDISIEQGIQIRDQWTGGRVDFSRVGGGLALYAQFINPTPAVVADVRLRRALYHALDRQEMADVLQAGVGRVAHSYLFPNEPEYRETEASVVRYEYDPRRTQQLIQELGYTRGPDGKIQDVASQRFAVEVTTTSADFNQKTILSVADYWQRAGVTVDVVIIPPQRARDLEYRANFPGFTLTGARNGVRTLRNLHSSQTPLPETNYLGNNSSRYRNADLDALIDTFFKTVPREERIGVLRPIVRHVSEHLNWMGITYDVDPVMIGKRVRNVGTMPWNSHLWETD